MPNEDIKKKWALRSKPTGRSASTRSGEYVREEMEHVCEGKHRVKSNKQAIAIDLAKARCAGVKLPPPDSRHSSPETRKKAEQDTVAGD